MSVLFANGPVTLAESQPVVPEQQAGAIDTLLVHLGADLRGPRREVPDGRDRVTVLSRDAAPCSDLPSRLVSLKER
jgi:hypothetical protein